MSAPAGDSNAGSAGERTGKAGTMAILFVLVTFLLIITITYFRRPTAEHAQATAEPSDWPRVPVMTREAGFDIPKGYCFHPGHTWVLNEGHENARVGIDAFAANLVGTIDRIETVEPNRWVRQGQRLCTLTREGKTVDLLSPIEGVVASVNRDVVKDPSLIVRDPYKNGWVCVVKAPDLTTNLRNLIQGPLVTAWMQNTLARAAALTQQLTPSLAQDGGAPVKGLLMELDPAARSRVVSEFFLT